MITRESGICPDKYQLKQIERRFGMFIHFGINTFANCEWSDIMMGFAYGIPIQRNIV